MSDAWALLIPISLFAFVLGLHAFLDAREWGGVPWWRRNWMLRNGVPATAFVKEEMLKSSSYRTSGVQAFASTLILEVRPPNGEPYEAVSRMRRTFGEGLYVEKGKIVPVRIAPGGEVIVDLEAARAEHAREKTASQDSFEAKARAIEERQRR